MLIDLHAKPSDALPFDQIRARSRSVGLDAIVVVDRFDTTSYARAKEAAQGSELSVFFGLEIPTAHGLLLAFVPDLEAVITHEAWETLTAFVPPEANEIIEFIATTHKGAVVASRPYDLDMPYNMGDMIFTFKGLHGVEVFNSRVGDLQNNFALEAALALGVATCGGSDAQKEDALGHFATFFPSNIGSQADLVKALRTGEFWGIQLGNLQRPATTIRPSTSSERDERRGGSRDSSSRGGDRGGRSSGGGSRSSSDRGGRGSSDRGGRGSGGSSDRGGRGSGGGRSDRGGRSGGGDGRRSGGGNSGRRKRD